MSGKLLTRSTVAVDQAFSVCRRSLSDSAKLSAGRMLVQNWLGVSLRFEAQKKLAEVTDRVTMIEKQYKSGNSHCYWNAAATGIRPQGASPPTR